MKCFRGVLVCFLISGLVGCQSERSVVVTEYRPAAPDLTERKAPDSEVFQLVRWQPIAPVVTAISAPTTRPSKPLRQMPVEVEQVYAPRGTLIGFQRNEGQLLAVAGPTTRPLEEAHYTWRSVPGSNSRDEQQRRRMDDFGGAVGTAIVATIVVAVVLLVVHDRRHTLLDDLFNSD